MTMGSFRLKKRWFSDIATPLMHRKETKPVKNNGGLFYNAVMSQDDRSMQGIDNSAGMHYAACGSDVVVLFVSSSGTLLFSGQCT